jgi:long-chain acyl-CoA synthetase
LPEVIDCTIEGVEDDIEGEMLKATVTVRKENAEAVTRERLIQHCSQHLALFKVPQVYEFRDNLTISATGKKIKKA